MSLNSNRLMAMAMDGWPWMDEDGNGWIAMDGWQWAWMAMGNMQRDGGIVIELMPIHAKSA